MGAYHRYQIIMFALCSLATVAEGYLKRSWNTADGESNKGSKFNRDIENMIQVSFGRKIREI